MSRILVSSLAFLASLWLGIASAQEPARLALLIGNQGYTKKVGPLKNPHNDVDLVATALTKVGFKVTVVKDAGYKALDTALKRHVTEVRRAGAGALSFFYYSGHGVANPETQVNYLVPVDVADAEDDKLWFESFQQNTIIDLLSTQAQQATHYLVFDACRNELNVGGSNAKALGTDKGFVPVNSSAGLLIAYATAPKRTASDVGAGGGPYAKVLAEEIVKPGIEAVSMFRSVQIRVKQSIGQDPWLTFPSLPAVYFGGKPDTISNLSGDAEWAWNLVKDTNSIAALEAFAERYTATTYSQLARTRIEWLKKQQEANAATKQADERKRVEVETARKRADDDAKAKLDAERHRLAMLQQEEDRKRTEVDAARKAARDVSGREFIADKSPWVKLCEAVPVATTDKDGKEVRQPVNVCMTTYERLDGNSGLTIVSAAVREVEGQKPYFMVMVPRDIDVKSGARALFVPFDLWDKVVKGDQVEERRLTDAKLEFSMCHAGGCNAEIEASQELITRAISSGGFFITFVRNRGEHANILVPLAGFEKAFAGKPMDNNAYVELRRQWMTELATKAATTANSTAASK